MLLERNELTRQVQGSPNIRSVYLLAPADLHQAGGEGLVLCCLALRAPHLGCQQLNVENVPHASPTSGREQLEHQVCAVVSVDSASPHACPGRLASEQCVASYFSFASRLPVFLEVISALLSEALWQPCAPLPTCVESQESSPDSAETQHLGSANCKLGDETKLPGDQQSRVVWGCRKDGKEF